MLFEFVPEKINNGPSETTNGGRPTALLRSEENQNGCLVAEGENTEGKKFKCFLIKNIILPSVWLLNSRTLY